MSETKRLLVEIDERIRQSPDLYATVVKGTEYFESEFHTLPPDPLWGGGAFLKWLPTPGRDGHLRMVFGEIKHRSRVASQRVDRFILELGNTDG